MGRVVEGVLPLIMLFDWFVLLACCDAMHWSTYLVGSGVVIPLVLSTIVIMVRNPRSIVQWRVQLVLGSYLLLAAATMASSSVAVSAGLSLWLVVRFAVGTFVCGRESASEVGRIAAGVASWIRDVRGTWRWILASMTAFWWLFYIPAMGPLESGLRWILVLRESFVLYVPLVVGAVALGWKRKAAWAELLFLLGAVWVCVGMVVLVEWRIWQLGVVNRSSSSELVHVAMWLWGAPIVFGLVLVGWLATRRRADL